MVVVIGGGGSHHHRVFFSPSGIVLQLWKFCTESEKRHAKALEVYVYLDSKGIFSVLY